MRQVLATKIITFTEDELINDGTVHITSLPVTIGCRKMIIARILIDNGFVLYVCPSVTTIWALIDLL